jgi:thiaminase
MPRYTTSVSSQTFWDAAGPLIKATESHPFLTSMVDGTLPIENFRYYVVQDALYLRDFAAALRILANSEGLSREDSGRLDGFASGAEEAELCLHNGFFQQWGIEVTGKEEQMPNTLLYTSYMLRVAATRPHPEGLAVLLPCFWVYMHVGKCMQQLRTDLGDRYGGTALAAPVLVSCRFFERVSARGSLINTDLCLLKQGSEAAPVRRLDRHVRRRRL